MKRLLWYLNQITESDTDTFRYTVMEEGRPAQKEIYDGECSVVYLKPGGEVLNPDRFGVRREPTYWQDKIAYTFDRTHRTALSRPTVTIAIPAARLGLGGDHKNFTPASADYCLRRIKPYFDAINAAYANKARPDSDNGKFYVYAPGGEVLTRNTAYFQQRPDQDYTNGRGALIYETKFTNPTPTQMYVCVRIEIQLPHGKLKRAKKMLTQDLPGQTEKFVHEFDTKEWALALALEEKQNVIRRYLRENGYAAFIANGSILAREKGTALPMKNARPFVSAPADEIEIAHVRGMGIKRGVTVITGGGYSGKSTVLNAISAGMYNHAAGDGRELCITDDSAATITAEDGRAVSRLNISPFIRWIPGGDTRVFSTEHASGSTSQAANIMEAMECGAKLLLIDEDRSATNFMIRDSLMRALVEKEPITPFTGRVRELSANGVSTILVIGGSGEYLSVADKIYMMDDFIIKDVTARAKELAAAVPLSPGGNPPIKKADWRTRRSLLSGGFTSYPEGSGSEKLAVSDTGFIIIGDERIDIRTLHGLATAAQVNALALMLRRLARGTDEMDELEALALSMRGIDRRVAEREIDIDKKIKDLYQQINEHGLNMADTGFFTGMDRFMDLPRPFELRAAINRMRRVSWQ